MSTIQERLDSINKEKKIEYRCSDPSVICGCAVGDYGCTGELSDCEFLYKKGE